MDIWSDPEYAKKRRVAAVTNNHKLGDLKNINVFSHSSRGQKSEIRCQQN